MIGRPRPLCGAAAQGSRASARGMRGLRGATARCGFVTGPVRPHVFVRWPLAWCHNLLPWRHNIVRNPGRQLRHLNNVVPPGWATRRHFCSFSEMSRIVVAPCRDEHLFISEELLVRTAKTLGSHLRFMPDERKLILRPGDRKNAVAPNAPAIRSGACAPGENCKVQEDEDVA